MLKTMQMTEEIKAVLIKAIMGVPLTDEDRDEIEQVFYTEETEERDYVRKKLFPRCAA